MEDKDNPASKEKRKSVWDRGSKDAADPKRSSSKSKEAAPRHSIAGTGSKSVDPKRSSLKTSASRKSIAPKVSIADRGRGSKDVDPKPPSTGGDPSSADDGENDAADKQKRRLTFVETLREKESRREAFYTEKRAAQDRASVLELEERRIEFEREQREAPDRRERRRRMTEIADREDRIKMDSIQPNLEELAIKHNLLPGPAAGAPQSSETDAGKVGSQAESGKDQHKQSLKVEHLDGDPRDPTGKRVSFDAGAAKRLSFDAAAREKTRRLSLIAEGKDPDKVLEQERRASKGADGSTDPERRQSSKERRLSGQGRRSIKETDANDPGPGSGQDTTDADGRPEDWMEKNFNISPAFSVGGSDTGVDVDVADDASLVDENALGEEEHRRKAEELKYAWWSSKDTILLNSKLQVAENSREVLSKAQFVCLFFATHMSYQTRVLVKFMNLYIEKMRADNCSLEFIFVSMDDTEHDCQQLIAELGDYWFSVPWTDQIHRRFARNQCNISRNPRLVILKNVGEGIILTGHAKDDIQERGEGAWYHWLELDGIMEHKRSRKRRESQAQAKKNEEDSSPHGGSSPQRPSS